MLLVSVITASHASQALVSFYTRHVCYTPINRVKKAVRIGSPSGVYLLKINKIFLDFDVSSKRHIIRDNRSYSLKG